MLGLFAFIISGLYRFGLIDSELFPKFARRIFFDAGKNSEPETPRDDGNMYDFLREGGTGGSAPFGGSAGFSLEITLDNIRDILINLVIPDNLRLETVAEYFSQDGRPGSRTEKMLLWKKGAKYRYSIETDSAPDRLYINDSENEFFEDFTTGDNYARPVSGAFSFSFGGVPHIKDINYYLSLLESGEITNHTIYQNDESNRILIRYFDETLSQREDIIISLDTGIVLSAESFTGENMDLYYRRRTTVLEAYFDGDAQSAANTQICENLFEIPLS
jgi:hypothetical protein